MAQDDIVLTGLSGRLPDSGSIDEFAEKLFAGVDLVTADDRRWTPGMHGLPERNGKLKDLQYFDATFFGVHAKQAHLMDPQLRLLLEITQECIVDAGYDPAELRGSRTGVFVGVSNSETEEKWTAEPDKINGYALTGCCRAMFPNRVSYTFDLKGPSYAVDTACSSSMFALAAAAAALRAGHCDAAVVAGTNLCLKPANSLNFHRLSMLSPEGRCAAFDAGGRGYVRSEAAVAVLLQRRGAARRVYCALRHVLTNTDGHKEQGITFPAGAMQARLARETLAAAGVRPEDVSYVEAHGTGTKVGDPQEVNAIADVFCGSRRAPLLLGSVKSNMGHSEPASGLCSVAKVLLAMERRCLPANLHYSAPNPDIPALSDGRIKVVSENTKWDGGIVAINSFGFGGANAHVLLETDAGAPVPPPPPRGVPALLVASGRTEEAVAAMLAVGRARPQDSATHALIRAVHEKGIAGHSHRGYAVLGTADQPDMVDEDVMECPADRRPLWWVFSGMGSQWAGMGRELLQLPAAAASLRRAAAALQPHGVDLLHVITEAKEEAFDDVINSFVGIAAVQVALVDVLRALRVEPDGLLGHSVGEVGCAYADGTLTQEQAVLAAYWRGRSIRDAKLPAGAMAALGLSADAARARLPSDVVLACHNSEDSVTVSGPVESIEKLVSSLSAEGVFARRVKSSGIAFHSKYIASAAPLLLASLKKIIPQPKERSARWVSTSLSAEQRDTALARHSSAEYHVNNLVSPVGFAEALRRVPADAVVVEVAPHALLSAVLRRALPQAAQVPLVRRDKAAPLRQLLAACGRLFALGGAPAVSALYAPPAWPVPRGTPPLASAVRWDHGIEWSVAHFGKSGDSGENIIEVDLSKPEDEYLRGHDIDGRVLFPATGYLTLVWRTLARQLARRAADTPVVLEDVAFERATILSPDAATRFLVSVLPGSGQWEIREGGAVAARGRVRLAERAERLTLAAPAAAAGEGLLPLDDDDVYKELRLRGYHYKGAFKGVVAADALGGTGELVWKDNWVSFIDTMLQFSIVGTDARGLHLPTRLQRALIDPERHALEVQKAGGSRLPIHCHQHLGVVQAGGVELRGLKTSLAPRRADPQPAAKLERYEWVPLQGARAGPRRDAVSACVQLALENSFSLRLRVCAAGAGAGAAGAGAGAGAAGALLRDALAVLDTEPQVRADAVLVGGAEVAALAEELGATVSAAPSADCHLLISAGVLSDGAALASLAGCLAPTGSLLLAEAAGAGAGAGAGAAGAAGLVVVARHLIEDGELVLLRKKQPVPTEFTVIQVSNAEYGWVEALRAAVGAAAAAAGGAGRVYVVGDHDSGVTGLATCLRAEPGGTAVRALQLDAPAAFTPGGAAYRAVVEPDLAAAVQRGAAWGSYRHLLLAADGAEEPTLQVEHAYVNTLTRGDLASLRWLEAPAAAAGAELCAVHYAPLNFRDIMLASGRLPPDALPGRLAMEDCILGLEFSGVDSKGRRVMGTVAAKGLATHVVSDPKFLWEVPSNWTLEQASTVPVAYSTAYYALVVRGRMAPGDAVLVHAGSGGVGQAAIAVALHAGCTVFTTVGTQEKRDFLKKTFPKLQDENIGSSRDGTFEQMVRSRTKGRGVDLVLNSLAGELLQASVRCLAEGGRFLEIGKLDLSRDSPLGMSVFLKNTTFHGILLDALFEDGGSEAERAAVVQCVRAGLAAGAVRPLPATVFAHTELEPAFRFMAAGKHIGKVVLKLRGEDTARAAGAAAGARTVAALPGVHMRARAAYVLVGGLGGFGLELAGWLVARGATCLVFNSRSGVKTGYQAWLIRRWRAAGVTVLVSTHDASSAAGARALLAAAAALAPVAGVFNLAAVLRDAFLENQTPEDFKTVAKAKVDGSIALDVASRALCPQLEHFVMWSSVSCGRGNAGQTNYGYANAAMERLAERRRRDALPALAVQWGAVGDVGLVTQMAGGADAEQAVGGTLPQRMRSCLAALGALMARPHAVAASCVLADKRRAPAQAGASLVAAVANILGIKDVTKVSDTVNLAELGMDSLMGAEIKQTLERGHDLVLAVHEIRALTFGKLKDLSGEAGAAGAAAPAAAPAAPAAPAAAPAPVGDQLVQFSADEMMPTEELVTLPSEPARRPGTEPVFMVHPMEGGAGALGTLARHVRGRVLALQCTRAAPLGTLQALAAHYVQRVRAEHAGPRYTLCGYSYGAAVAVEMALQIEKAGLKTQVILVDGSPSYVASHLERQRGRRTAPGAPAAPVAPNAPDSPADQAEALIYFLQLFREDFDVAKVARELVSLPSLEARASRVEALAAPAPAGLRDAALSFYRRLAAGMRYRPQGQLKGPVLLFTARDNYVALDAEYGLRGAARRLAARQLPASHRSIITGDCAAAIAAEISRALEADD